MTVWFCSRDARNLAVLTIILLNRDLPYIPRPSQFEGGIIHVGKASLFIVETGTLISFSHINVKYYLIVLILSEFLSNIITV